MAVQMTELAAAACALIAGVGLQFAGWQLMIMNRAAAMERRVARERVVVARRPIEARVNRSPCRRPGGSRRVAAKRADDFVADGVLVRVADRFEVVDIDHHCDGGRW
jgi:hypothetical protein